MSYKIRHLERKIVVYGTLVVTFGIPATALCLPGTSPGPALVIPGAVLAALVATYTLFDRAAGWLLGAKPAGKADEPRAFRIVEDICKRRGYRMLALAILPDPTVNAFVAGVARNRTTLFISPVLLRTLDDEELAMVVKHELEAIDELSWFPYNAVMITLAVLIGLARRARSMTTPKNPYPVAGQDERITVDRAGVPEVPAAIKLLVADGMYTGVYVNDLSRLATDGSPLFLVARYDCIPAGFVIGEVLPGGRGHISKIVVDGRFRRKGIGNLLLQAFVRSAQRTGCRSCHLEVRADNVRAISLYQKQDFKKERILPGYYPDGASCQIMVKTFSG